MEALVSGFCTLYDLTVAEQPPDVYTTFSFMHEATNKDIPFRIDVRWNKYAKKWRWFLMPPDRRWENLALQLGDKISYIAHRRPSNSRGSLVLAIEDGIRKVEWPYERSFRMVRKRWAHIDPAGPIQWDGVWVEQ